MNILSREEIIPLTPQAAAVLLAWAGGLKHGYVISQFCISDSSGIIDVSPGSMHHLLRRLIDQGMIEPSGRAKASASPYERKLYRLTAFGRQVLEWETERQEEYVGLARMRMRQM